MLGICLLRLRFSACIGLLSFPSIISGMGGVISEIFSIFLHYIARSRPEYTFFFVGIHERSPLRSALEKQPHISYGSKLYVVAWDEQQQHVEHLERHREVYLECGML